jgi:hypothetical protein
MVSESSRSLVVCLLVSPSRIYPRKIIVRLTARAAGVGETLME